MCFSIAQSGLEVLTSLDLIAYGRRLSSLNPCSLNRKLNFPNSLINRKLKASKLRLLLVDALETTRD